MICQKHLRFVLNLNKSIEPMLKVIFYFEIYKAQRTLISTLYYIGHYYYSLIFFTKTLNNSQTVLGDKIRILPCVPIIQEKNVLLICMGTFIR